MKSARTFAISGMFGYLMTRYPAAISIASRSSSFPFFVRCVASSSSMTARTWKALSQTTKSATLRSNVLRAPYDFAVSKAEKLTCASTIKSGTDWVSRLCIACSRSVSSSGFFRGFSSLVARPPFFLFIKLAKKSSSTPNTTAIMSKDFTFPPVVCSGRNRNEWLSVADFSVAQSLAQALKARAAAHAEGPAPAGGAACAAAAPQPLPVGNHGEIYAKGSAV